ncbi:MAG: cellulase family glycosylhydrolase, partial [Methylobacteriaceae bacterium]|nr:cellulase family glycosylhydrolase [Methylobacteriaceae bacterium]
HLPARTEPTPGSVAIDRRAMLAGLAGLAAASGAKIARAAGSGPALGRGLNLAHWFAQSEHGYGPDHLASFVRADDLRALAGAGFSHVRLGLEPDALFAEGGGPPRFAEPYLSHLRAALDAIAAAGLTTVLDLHPVGASKNILMTQAGADLFKARWGLLADAMARGGPDRLVLEILNEPYPVSGEAWWTLQADALAAIRTSWSGRPVIVNGGGWSGVEDVAARRAYRDPDLIYTVHVYAPLLFTHQAADWTWDVARTIAGLPWPVAPGDAAAVARAATADERSRTILENQIALGAFTRAALDDELSRLEAWSAAQGHVPIYVGEFGVYAKAAPEPARLAWLRAVRESCEARGWGWALWGSSPAFGLVEAGRRPWRFDAAALDALRSAGRT